MTHWLAKNPATLMGIQQEKGSIAVGKCADFVVWDPEGQILVTKKSIYSAHYTNSLCLNKLIHAEIHATYLRGQLVCNEGTIVHKHGRLLLRSPAPAAALP
jgi:dihydroorotase-like cyclic amidohydrolase